MRDLGDFLVKTFRFYIAFTIVLFGYSWLIDLDKDAEDFLYLSGIVKEVTEDKVTQEDKVKALTEWLSVNVIKTMKYPGWEKKGYPPWFDGSSVASVIKGGIGNCGYQANNIITLSRYLGIRANRRYWVGERSGSKYEHAFAELIVDGKPRVFDPNMLVFQESSKGGAMGLKEMVSNPDVIENEIFRKIVTEIRDKPSVVRITRSPTTPEPLGKSSYAIYSSFGTTATKMYIHLRSSPLTIIFLSWLVFYLMGSVIKSLGSTKKYDAG